MSLELIESRPFLVFLSGRFTVWTLPAQPKIGFRDPSGVVFEQV
jgi:hypothetical protein